MRTGAWLCAYATTAGRAAINDRGAMIDDRSPTAAKGSWDWIAVFTRNILRTARLAWSTFVRPHATLPAACRGTSDEWPVTRVWTTISRCGTLPPPPPSLLEHALLVASACWVARGVCSFVRTRRLLEVRRPSTIDHRPSTMSDTSPPVAVAGIADVGSASNVSSSCSFSSRYFLTVLAPPEYVPP